MSKASYLAAAMLAVGVLFAQEAAAQAPKVLNLGFVGRQTAPEGIAMTSMAEKVKQRTAGRVDIRLHPGGALGGDREVIEGVQIGTVEMTISSTSIFANFVPDVQVLDIPFLFRDFDHAQGVLDGAYGKELLAKFDARGFKGLALGGIGFRQLTNSKRPVTGVDDVKGLKIRTQENPIHIQVWRALGSQPTPMAIPEVFTALQQGVMDGQENPIGAIINNRFGQVQKYLTISNHAFTPVALVISPAAFASLSPADRQVLQEEATAAMAVCKDEVAKVEKTGVDTLRGLGMQVVEKVDTSKFQAALAPTFADLAKRFGEATINRIKDHK
jgi:tripartite ATP-independent transporter DctP family solute receptor